MRIPSGSTDRYVYFVAVDPTDLKTRETGLSGFTVYASLNGGAAGAFTTPTVNETDSSNMPGVYELLLDEYTTLTAGNDTEELCLHITQASMQPVTRVVEIYRPETTEGNTLDVTTGGAAGIDWGNVENPTTSVGLSGTTVGTCTANTDMRGTDSALLAASAPANFDDLAITATTGMVTVGTNGDKTGYYISGTKTTLDALNDLSSSDPVGSVTGNVGGSVASVASGGITAASIATDAIDADALKTDAVTEIVAAIWNAARATYNSAGSFGEGAASVQGNVTGSVASVAGNVGGNVTGSVGSVASGGITAASVATGAIDADAIASSAITDAKIASGAITAAKFAAGAIDASAIDTDAIDADALKTDAVTEIVNAVLTGTNLSELSQAKPSATPSLSAAIMLLYMALRNQLKVDTSGTPDYKEIYNDAGTCICKKQVSDDGSTYTEAEMETGP